MQTDKSEIKEEYEKFLLTLGIGCLRSLGRYIGVAKSTEKKKAELIKEILSVEFQESEPCERNKRGAPVKDDYIDPKVLNKVSLLRDKISGKVQVERDDRFIIVSDSHEAPETLDSLFPEQFKGKLVLEDDGYSLDNGKEKLAIARGLVEDYSINEGDVVCVGIARFEEQAFASIVFSINGALTLQSRFDYERCEPLYPNRRFHFQGSFLMKTLEYVLPVGKGQRLLVCGSRESNKSRFIYEMLVNLYSTLPIYILLVGQPPEYVNRMKSAFPTAKLMATELGEAPEETVKKAENFLSLAKTEVNTLKDVLFVVDRLDVLVKAYNDTESAKGGKVYANGLESKSVQFVTKYFASARETDRASLTMVCSVERDDNDEWGLMLEKELSSIANSKIVLEKRFGILPSSYIDLSVSETDNSGDLFVLEDEIEASDYLKYKIYAEGGAEALLKKLQFVHKKDDILKGENLEK